MKCVNEIMDWFDFAKVAKVMEALDWKWANERPSEPEIRARARELIEDAVKNKRGIASGGFFAKYQEEEGEEFIELSFVVDSWDCHIKQGSDFDWEVDK